MKGHFPPEVGRAMEDDFAILLERLGYRVLRKRDVKSGLDIIAEFDGNPINPKPKNRCNLLPPKFSPEGITAFSLKRGNIGKTDIDELLFKVIKTREFIEDKVLSSINGSIIVTNYTKTEKELDDILANGIYCWDIRRLIFYSSKVRSNYELSSNGPTWEMICNGKENTSYLLETGDKIGSGAILLNVIIFVDDHEKELILGHDHIINILEDIYKNSFRPIINSTGLDIQTRFKIHILGIADINLVETGYKEYAENSSLHPRAVFSAKPMIFQYGAAPWMPILHL